MPKKRTDLTLSACNTVIRGLASEARRKPKKQKLIEKSESHHSITSIIIETTNRFVHKTINETDSDSSDSESDSDNE